MLPQHLPRAPGAALGKPTAAKSLGARRGYRAMFFRLFQGRLQRNAMLLRHFRTWRDFGHNLHRPCLRQIEVSGSTGIKIRKNHDFYPKSQNRENHVKLINLRGILINQFSQKLIQPLI